MQKGTLVGAQYAEILEEVLRQSVQAKGSGMEGLQAVGHGAARRDDGLGVPLLKSLATCSENEAEGSGTEGESPEDSL